MERGLSSKSPAQGIGKIIPLCVRLPCDGTPFQRYTFTEWSQPVSVLMVTHVSVSYLDLAYCSLIREQELGYPTIEGGLVPVCRCCQPCAIAKTNPSCRRSRIQIRNIYMKYALLAFGDDDIPGEREGCRFSFRDSPRIQPLQLVLL